MCSVRDFVGATAGSCFVLAVSAVLVGTLVGGNWEGIVSAMFLAGVSGIVAWAAAPAR